MISRYPILAFGLTVALAVYLAVVLAAARAADPHAPMAGYRICIDDTSSTGFVNEEDISHELGGLSSWSSHRPRGYVSTRAIEERLRRSDKIEDVNVYFLNNGALRIDVTPMVPVARVFENGRSYYINSTGKRISADPRYHIDVPVVVGSFPASRPAVRLLPLLSYIASRPDLDALVSTVLQDRRGDIFIIPSIRGHVVNFGDTTAYEDKFRRLTGFYRTVLPYKGWETYDTIAVKWRGRIVATKRDKALAAPSLAAAVEQYDDAADSGTMTTPLHSDSSVIH